MVRIPSSNSACAVASTLGSATGAMGAAVVPGPTCADVPHPDAQRPTASAARVTVAGAARLLVTAHLLDPVEGDLRLADARGQADLALLRVLVLGQPRQRLPDRLRVLVVDADLQRLGVARLVRVERL